MVPVTPALEGAPPPPENAADALRRTFIVEAATAQEADRCRMPNRRKPQLSKSGACWMCGGWFIVVRAALSFTICALCGCLARSFICSPPPQASLILYSACIIR